MTRFALIPFAIFASACADSADLTETADGLEQEFKEMVEEYHSDTERRVAKPVAIVAANQQPPSAGTIANKRVLTIGQKVAGVASDRFAHLIEKQDCEMVGAAYGMWRDQRLDFRGEMFHDSGKPMARLHGELAITGNGTGEIGAFGVGKPGKTMKVAMEGDWKGSTLDADVFIGTHSQVEELVLIGDIEGVLEGRGHFIGALADCS